MTGAYYWRTAVKALQRGFIRNSPRERLEPVHEQLMDCICAFWVQEVPKPPTSLLSKRTVAAATGAPQGAMEHREESININEEQKEAEEQSEYLAELEQLFGVDKGHMPTIWEQPQNPLISDPGTGCSVPGAYNPHQTFCTECMDVVQDAHHVMWCDTAKPRPCL